MKNKALLLISFGGNLHNFLEAKPENLILKDKGANKNKGKSCLVRKNEEWVQREIKINIANKALFQKENA